MKRRSRLEEEIEELVGATGAGSDEDGDDDDDEAGLSDEARVEEGFEVADVGRSSLRARASEPVLDPALGGKAVSRADLASWLAGENDDDDDDEEEEEKAEEEVEEEDGETLRTKAAEEADRLRRELLEQERQRTAGANGDEDNDDGFAVMAHGAAQVDAEKALHAQTQARLWEACMETRIHMQPLLVAAERLPRPAAHALFCAQHGGDDVAGAFADAAAEARALVCDLDALDCELWNANTEMRDVAGPAEPLQSAADGDNDDDSESLWKRLGKRHLAFRRYTTAIIDKWHQRTLVGGTGLGAGSRFKAVNLTLSQQIDQALEDKARLIRRTRIRRTAGRVFGEPSLEATQQQAAHHSQQKPPPQQQQQDVEIFDDADFYTELLRELIETNRHKSEVEGIAAELEQLRRRKKRVGLKHVSKGRAIRYDVIPELVNFMAPVDTPTARTDWDADQLFANLFGQQQQQQQQTS